MAKGASKIGFGSMIGHDVRWYFYVWIKNSRSLKSLKPVGFKLCLFYIILAFKYFTYKAI